MSTLNEAFKELNKINESSINESRSITVKTRDGKTTIIDKEWLDYRIGGYDFIKKILDGTVSDDECESYYYTEYNFDENPPADEIEKLIFKALRNRLEIEDIKEAVSAEDDLDAKADDKKEEAEKELEKKEDDADSLKDEREDSAEKDFEKAEDDADADRDDELENKKLEESDKPAAVSIEDAQKWVDYDMEKYGRISMRTNRLVRKAGFQIVKDDHGDYEVIVGHYE